MIEPPVCEPMAARHMPAATAAAEPLDDPPGVRSRSWGFRVGGGSKQANAVVTVLPISTAPACLSLETSGASQAAGCGRPVVASTASTDIPAAVGSPTTSTMSLIATGIPCSGPAKRPVSAQASSSAARARASEACTETNACRSPSEVSIRSRHSETSSVAVVSRVRTAAAASTRVVGFSGTRARHHSFSGGGGGTSVDMRRVVHHRAAASSVERPTTAARPQ